MTSSVWDQISKEAKDFISKLLVAIPEDRLTAAQLRSHPWITGTNTSTQSINVLERMRGWNTKRKIELEKLKKAEEGTDKDFMD